MKSFAFYRQLNQMDCGPSCLRMIASYHGRHFSGYKLREASGYSKEGVSLLGLSDAAEGLGFLTRGAQITFEKLLSVPLPSILHWSRNHYVVLTHISQLKITVADPAVGVLTYTKHEFLKFWSDVSDDRQGAAGTVLLLEPTPAFYSNKSDQDQKLNWWRTISYLRSSRSALLKVFISLVIGSGIQFMLPFLTKNMVDRGINARNLHLITLMLIAQLTLTLSSAIVEFFRNRLQLRIANTVNIAILSDFWAKLTRLPLVYFERHHTGDVLQRIQDNKQVQAFLTGQTLNTVFSMLSFVVFAVILIDYSFSVFSVFVLGNLIYFVWVSLFISRRRKINYEIFDASAKENSATLQLVQGMTEIRLNNAEKSKRWEWENIQLKLFKLSLKNLNFSQWQSAGSLVITQGKDILISFMVAEMVVERQLSFGTMLAVQYIAGQLGGPIGQFIGLSQSLQDTKISLERLNEIHDLPDEEPAEETFLTTMPDDHTLRFENVTFTYPGAGNEPVLQDINLIIPEGKITAIVGTSGSGKTTLLKLLLQIYKPRPGTLYVGDKNLQSISAAFWRKQCGVVLQDGYLFDDTIAGNIVVSNEKADRELLIHSCRIANILSFIEALPNGFETRLGAEGIGLSQGQRQRLLIARAVYKAPQYIFFDEATNALDANNEREIVEQLNHFFEGRTVVVVAHRLSTVKNATNIVVLSGGKITEQGSHEQLVALRGDYYRLVRNQLELTM